MLVTFVCDTDANVPSYSTNTELVVPVLDDLASISSLSSLLSMENAWIAKIIAAEDNSVRVQVSVSANAIVGEWMLRIESKSREKGDESKFAYNCKEAIYILFNPWSKSEYRALIDSSRAHSSPFCRGCRLHERQGSAQGVRSERGTVTTRALRRVQVLISIN